MTVIRFLGRMEFVTLHGLDDSVSLTISSNRLYRVHSGETILFGHLRYQNKWIIFLQGVVYEIRPMFSRFFFLYFHRIEFHSMFPKRLSIFYRAEN